MAPASRRSHSDLIQLLADEPHRFHFFQAVRLVEQQLTQEPSGEEQRLSEPVGYDHAPSKEAIRFQSHPSFQFPPSEIAAVSLRPGGKESPQFKMTVPFIGLYGPTGVLPRYYTQMVVDQCNHKDTTLRDYLDLFNHRTTSLFYRIWKKYRFFLEYERLKTRLNSEDKDLFTLSLFALVGGRGRAVREKFNFFDETLLHFGGNFARRSRPAGALQTMLRDFFDLPISVLQFLGQWLQLRPSDQTALPTAENPQGLNTALGKSAIAGSRVWSIENHFRLRIGPVDRATFRSLMPGTDKLKEIAQFTRAYVGPSLAFDIQVVLLANEVPQVSLDSSTDAPELLGQSTWLCSRPPESDAEEAVFHDEGNPNIDEA